MKLNTLHEGDNIGSLAAVRIAHCTDFLNFNPVVFREGRDWLDIDITPETGSLEPDHKETENGDLFTYKGKFSIHHPTDALDAAMRPFIGQKAVLYLVDMNGRVYIIGHPSAPVTLAVNGSTGTRYIGAPQNEYSFQVEMPVPAAVV